MNAAAEWDILPSDSEKARREGSTRKTSHWYKVDAVVAGGRKEAQAEMASRNFLRVSARRELARALVLALTHTLQYIDLDMICFK